MADHRLPGCQRQSYYHLAAGYIAADYIVELTAAGVEPERPLLPCFSAHAPAIQNVRSTFLKMP